MYYHKFNLEEIALGNKTNLRRRCCCSVTQPCLTLYNSMDCSKAGFPSLSPRICSKSCPLSQWCHPTFSTSVASFSSCPRSFLASGCFPVSWLATSGGQSIGVPTSALDLPMNIQGWFPLALTGVISLLSKELSRVFSNTTVWKHQFFGAQLSLWSNFPICTWLLEKP